MIIFKPNRYLDKLDKIFKTDIERKAPSIALMNNDTIARSMIGYAIITTPYILWLLYKLKKFKWLLFFGLFVVLPYLLLNHFLKYSMWHIISYLFPLFLLCIYHMMLKNSYQNWREPLFINKKDI